MARRYALRDDQWERIKDFLPGREGHVGGTAKDNRLFIEAVLYRYRAGIAWRDLPERFGDFRVIHTRHTRWSKRGVWQRIFEHLAKTPTTNTRCSIPPSSAHTSTQPAQKGGRETECIGRSKGGLTTKIHARGDALGNPTGFHLTPGQAHDLEGVDALLPDILETSQAFLADKAYDAQERALDRLVQAGVKPVIPPKSNRAEQRDYDKDLCIRPDI